MRKINTGARWSFSREKVLFLQASLHFIQAPAVVVERFMEAIQLEIRGAVVIAHFPPHPSPDAVHEFFDQMEEMLLRRPLGLVLDAVAVRSAPISVRDVAGRRLRVMEPLLRRRLRAQATVVASPLVRGALATIHFFAPPKYPTQSFSDLESGIRWVEEQIGTGVER